MLEKRSFMFEFIKDYMRYYFGFEAMVNDATAKELYLDVLNNLYRSDFSCKHYISIFEDNFGYYMNRYNANNIECGAEYYYDGAAEYDWNLNNPERYSSYIGGKRKDAFERMEVWDYYFLISLNTEIRSEDFFADVKLTYLDIIKKTKEEGFNDEKHLHQFGKLSKGVEDFIDDSVSFDFSFDVTKENIDKEQSGTNKTVFHLEHDFSVDSFDLPVETVLPLEFEGVQRINTFTEYLKVLINIDSFRTIEDIKKLISTKQLVK